MIALDSNILVYAQQRDDTQGRDLAAFDIIAKASLRGAIVPLQTLGEFLNVCRTKLTVTPQDAIDQVLDYAQLFDCPATEVHDLTAAAVLADRYRLQFFDALIVTVASRAGATLLLSEDLQDGFEFQGLRIMNPFAPANLAELASLLT